jgi:hypothetical protein
MREYHTPDRQERPDQSVPPNSYELERGEPNPSSWKAPLFQRMQDEPLYRTMSRSGSIQEPSSSFC